jgi:Fanconi anemia group D2 protein
LAIIGVEFLQAKYDLHKDAINDLVKELQKATRIIQALCSEAKGQKRMPVACKVPAVKRSMEKFVFCVKALLHGASHGNSFWMGKF